MTDLTDNLRSILDQLPIAVWVGNVPDGSAAYANKEFERILLMPSVETSRIDDVPQTYGVFGRDGSPYPAEKLPFSRVLAEGAAVVVEDMVIRRPDRDISIRAFGSPLSRADGSMSHVIVAFFDITAERLAQREREVVQERFTSVCNYAPLAIWATDLEGTITLSEGAALAALGVKPGQLVGQNVFELYRDHPTVPGYVRRALAGESVWYSAADGEVIFESWLAPLRDQSGALVGLAGFSNDVTELRRLQSSVIQNDRVNAVGTLAASVAHEINNPLTYVLAHGEALSEELDTLEALLGKVDAAQAPALRACVSRMREELGPMRSGTAQIATITRDLRTFSRDDATTAPVSIRSVVDAVLKLVRKEIEARAELVLDLRDTPPVIANESRLVQVVLNLLVNALHASQAGGQKRQEIAIRTFVEGAKVVVEVSDSGPGVPVADRQRIFDPFYTTKEIGKGTGLGLFVCRNVVRGLGGDVVVSDAHGGGALFRVTLPAGAAMPPAVVRPSTPSLASTAGRHVVVIDDDAFVLRALSMSLQRAGFRVTTATDGQAGLEILMSGEPIDLVYCDLMMKGMTGMDVADAVGAKAPAMARKLVFMTGGAFSPKAQDFVAQHSEHTVGKPFDIVIETRRRLG